MSKLPKISANNSESFKNAMGFNYNGNDVYPMDEKDNKETNTNNNVIQNDNTFLPVISNRQNTINNTNIPTIHNFKGYFPLVIEAKLNDLETKIISLEQTNFILNERLKSNERNFELKIKEMEQINIEERESRVKLEKVFNFISDKSSNTNSELKSKIQLIQEIIEKEEKWKYEQRQSDIEMYKNIISKLTEKVSETVKMEIEARFKADLDNKNLIQIFSQKTLNEIDTVRREMDELGETTKSEIKEYSKECSLRAHNLSKYIDEVVAESSSYPKQSIDKMKTFISKLTDQIKTNIESQNLQNRTYDEKFNKLELFSNKIKEEVYNFVNIIEERLVKKMKELKTYTDLNIRRNFDALNGGVTELSKNTDKNINVLSTQLKDTRKILINRIKDLENSNKSQFKAICEDIESVAERVYFYEELLEKFEESNKETKTKIETDLATMQSAFHINTVNERILHKIEFDELKSDNNGWRNSVEVFQHKFTSDIEGINKKVESNFSSVYEKSKQTLDQMNKMYQNNIQIFKEFEVTFEKFQDESDALEINNLMNHILTQVEEKTIYDKINQIESSEKLLSSNYNKIESQLNEVDRGINNEKIHTEIRSLMNDILFKLEIKDNSANHNGISSKNNNTPFINQIDNDVSAVMEKMLNNLEKDEFSLFINSKLNRNDTKNKEVIERLTEFRDQLNHIEKEFSETNESTKKSLLEFNVIIENKINSILEKIKKENSDIWNKALEFNEKLNQPNGMI